MRGALLETGNCLVTRRFYHAKFFEEQVNLVRDEKPKGLSKTASGKP
jgi:hypothetical protein